MPVSYRPSVRRTLLRVAAVCCAFSAAHAVAADTESRLADLERRLATLEAENAHLRTRLGEPGVAPAPAVAPVPAPTAVRSLNVSGYTQLHAEFGGEPDARFTGIADRFFIRRADLAVKGDLGENFAFKFETELSSGSLGAKSGHTARLTDAFVTWTADEALSLQFGQFKSPFGRAQLAPNTRLVTIERPLVSDQLTVGRQVGVGANGVVSPLGFPLRYSVGVFNGTGANASFSTHSEFMTAGRLEARIWEQDASAWDLAVNAYHYDPAATGTDRRVGWGMDTRFARGAFATEAEYLEANYDRSAGPDVTARGWWIGTLWKVSPQWQGLVHYGTFDPNADIGRDDSALWTFGANYLIRGDDLKVSLNYLLGDAPAGRASRLLGRLQVKF